MARRVFSMSAIGFAGLLAFACDDVDTGAPLGVDPPGSTGSTAPVVGTLAVDGSSTSPVKASRELVWVARPGDALRDHWTRAQAFATTAPVEPDEVVVDPVDGSTVDNLTCEQAVALPDSGAIDVPIHGDVGQGAGCFSSANQQRFFSVSVAPGEVALVTSPTAGSNSGIWFNAAPACDTPTDECRTDWTWLSDGVALANSGKTEAKRIVSVMTSSWTAGPTYDLDVVRERLADNATCAAARPIGDGLVGERYVGASVEPVAVPMRRVLYYTAEIPPMTRATVVLDGDPRLYTYLRWGCDDTDWRHTEGHIANATAETRTVIVMVGAFHVAPEVPFDLSLELAALAPEAACDQPRVMGDGDSVTLQTADGSDLAVTCWCLPSGRALYVAVDVPEGSTAVVRGATAGDQGGAILIELPEQCGVDTCGTNMSFGWSERPAELRIANDGTQGSRVATHQILVSSQTVWDAQGVPSSPPVTVTVDIIPSDDDGQP